MSKKIQISYPNFKLRKRSPNSYTKIVTIRIDRKQFEFIKNICNDLDITPNFFFGWCAYNSAKCIKNEMRGKNLCLNMTKNKKRQ